MSWQLRHQGSPQARHGLTLEQVIEGLRDGLWEPTDEVKGPTDAGWVALENHPALAEAAADLEPPPRPHVDETHLDMNALIDVCLVLLIFFIMTTTYALAVQQIVPLPTESAELKASSDPKKIRTIRLEQVKKNMIRVKAELGKDDKPLIWVENRLVKVLQADGVTLDVPKLSKELTAVRGDPPKTEMLLEARGVSWGLVIAIQDAAKSAGVLNICYPRQK